MSREVHVRFWESAGVRFPRATHLPLYRQEAIFERAGHLIARSALAQRVGECGAQLQPLVQALAAELRRHLVRHADETRVAVLTPCTGAPLSFSRDEATALASNLERTHGVHLRVPRVTELQGLMQKSSGRSGLNQTLFPASPIG